LPTLRSRSFESASLLRRLPHTLYPGGSKTARPPAGRAEASACGPAEPDRLNPPRFAMTEGRVNLARRAFPRHETAHGALRVDIPRTSLRGRVGRRSTDPGSADRKTGEASAEVSCGRTLRFAGRRTLNAGPRSAAASSTSPSNTVNTHNPARSIPSSVRVIAPPPFIQRATGSCGSSQTGPLLKHRRRRREHRYAHNQPDFLASPAH